MNYQNKTKADLLLKSIIDSTTDAIYVKDLQGRYTVLNAAAEKAVGKNAEDVLGKDDYFLFPADEAKMIMEGDQKVLEGESPVTYEEYVTTADGSKVMYLSTKGPLFDINGNKNGLFGVARDITERKNAEEQIKTILSTTIDGFYLVDTEGRILDTNDSYCSMIGYSREELIGMKVKDIEAADTEEVIQKRIQRILETGYARFETRHRRKDGRVIAVEASVNCLTDEQPKLFCFMRDISDRKEAEEKLIEKESDLNHAQKIAHVGSWKFDTKTQLTDWSENIYHIFGLNPENGPLDYPGHKRIIFPDDWKEFDNAVQLTSRTGEGYKLNIRIRRPSGELRWIITECETKKDPEGNVVELFGVCQDITESRQLEDELRRREERYSTILQTALDGFWVVDLDGNFMDVNESYCQLIGYNIDELLSMNISDVEVLEKKSETKRHLQQVIENGSDRFESKHRCKNGKLIEFDISVNYLPSEAKLFVFLRNITERNLAKIALQDSEERYRRLVEGSPDAIAVHTNGRFIFVNPAGAKLIGAKSPQELIGKPILDIVHPDSQSKVVDRLRHVEEGKEAPLFEEKFLKFDGSVIDVEVVGIPFPYQGQIATQVVVRDITERKRADEALRLEKENFRHSQDDSPLGVRIVSEEGSTIYANQTLLDFYGYYSIDELRNTPLVERYTPDSYSESQKRKLERISGDLSNKHYEIDIIRKNGETSHLKVYRKKVLWDGIWQFQVVYEDITEIKRREIELESSREQLEQLNLYLHRVREEERKLISRELHDELGQSLTAIKIDLGILKNSLSNQSKISQKIEKITSLLNDSIISVQRLTSELRPLILDDLGLVAAIDWYTGEYIKRTGITMNLNIDKSISLPNEVELVIFRILQESLTNIARHSGAENAEIIFYRQEKDVILEIKDDGIGISTVDKNSPKSLGLFNMNERAREIGGKFIIESRKKRGTRICLTVPDILFEEL